MKRVCAVACALVLLQGISSAEANYTMVGAFEGTASYFSGTRDFFRASSALDVDRVVGTISLTTTTVQPRAYVPGSAAYAIDHSGTLDYSFTLYDLVGSILAVSSGTGKAATLTVNNWINSKTTSSSLNATAAANGSLGGGFLPSALYMSFAADAAPSGLNLYYGNTNNTSSGSISVTMNPAKSSATVTPAIDYTEPPLPTPLPAAALLFVPGFAGLIALRKRFV